MTRTLWRWLCAFLLAGAMTLWGAHASAAPRRALLVGSREGSADQHSLRYTSDDVGRLSNVLKELGGFASGMSELHNPSAAQVKEKLEALAHGEKSELFVFYYSGHADGAGLSLSGTDLAFSDLLAKIAAVPADLRVIVLDACQSGAASRTKGVTIAPPFDVQARIESSTGDVIITSSSASEAAYESDTSRAGVFSLHFATALRGAGDINSDGAITITEAYQYAYAHTLRSTMLSSGGPQHPSFRYAVEGRQEPALTRLATAARLTLRASETGDFVIFDDQESRVLAEIHVEKEHQSRLALAPGRYLVRKRGTRDLRSARIALSANDDRVLDESRMPAISLIRLPPKGGLGSISFGLSAGQFWSALGEQGHLQLMLGPEWERATWMFRAEAVASFGTQEYNQLRTTEQTAGILLSALTGLRLGGVFLRVGPLAGGEMIFQQPDGRPSRKGFGLRVGPRFRADIPLGQSIGIYANLDVSVLMAAADGRVAGVAARVGDLGFFGSIGYGVGIVNSW